MSTKWREPHLRKFYRVSLKSVVAIWWRSFNFNGATTDLQQLSLKSSFLPKILQCREKIYRRVKHFKLKLLAFLYENSRVTVSIRYTVIIMHKWRGISNDLSLSDNFIPECLHTALNITKYVLQTTEDYTDFHIYISVTTHKWCFPLKETSYLFLLFSAEFFAAPCNSSSGSLQEPAWPLSYIHHFL